MSGSNIPLPMQQFRGGNPLMPARPVVPQVPTQPQAPAAPVFGMRHAIAAHANTDQNAMIRKRDTAGAEMSKLAEVANQDDPNRADIVAYIGKLTRTGQVSPDEATQILQALPEDASGIRQWARAMFRAVMMTGVHAHAAFPASVFPGEAQPSAPVEPAQPEGQEP